MLAQTRRLILLATVACVAICATSALGRTSRAGPLTGAWSGYIAGTKGSGVQRSRIRIVINAAQTGGSWQISASCHGVLTLDSISNGYHHYRRRSARGASCAGGDVDCLKRMGAEVYDAVTSHRGGAYDSSGTLRRVTT